MGVLPHPVSVKAASRCVRAARFRSRDRCRLGLRPRRGYTLDSISGGPARGHGDGMHRSSGAFGRDTGLQVRMLLTLFLLGLLYVGFVAVLLAAGAGVVMMVVIVGGLALAQLFFSDRLALRAMGAHLTTPE